MTTRVGNENLVCPNPVACPVKVNILYTMAKRGNLPVVTYKAGTLLYRGYSARFGYAEQNPGVGNARFSPFDAPNSQFRIPTMYLAETLDAALLESCLHGVWAASRARRPNKKVIVYSKELHGCLHARVQLPVDVTLVNLTNEELIKLGISREAIVNSPAEHYPCTRNVAKAIYGSAQKVDGILWHSRQAELVDGKEHSAMVLFTNRLNADRDDWKLPPGPKHVSSIDFGAGQSKLKQVLNNLNVKVVP